MKEKSPRPAANLPPAGPARPPAVPWLHIPPTPPAGLKSQSARPSHDALIEREIQSARSGLFAQELSNIRLQQQIRDLQERNSELQSQLYIIQRQIKEPQIVEVLPSEELISQNILLEQDNDRLREELNAYIQYNNVAESRENSAQREEGLAGENQRLREEILQLRQQVEALQRSGLDRKQDQYVLIQDNQPNGVENELERLKKQHESDAAEICRLRDELETEKCAFLEFLRLRREGREGEGDRDLQ